MDKLLLEKFIKGECTAEEVAQVEQWLHQHPDKLDEYLMGIWNEPIREAMPPAMEQAILNEAAAWPGYQQNTPQRKTTIHRWLYWSAAAAIIIGIAGWWFFRQPDSPTQLAHQQVIITAPAGEAMRYVLPDKSVVWLKANARLQVDTQVYNHPNRTVALVKGEAFFEVQKDTAHPFIVQNELVQTRVLGTSFSVQAGSPGGAILVTVATGKVAVSYHNKELEVLLPGKQISVQSKTGAFTKNTVPVWLASLWKETGLQLTNAPFAELQLAMEKLYGISLQTNSRAVKTEHYNIRLNRNTPVQEVIPVLALLNKHQYKKMNNTTWLLY
ncbi:MAG TPA: FecR domain-containing protein [Niastella sp.]